MAVRLQDVLLLCRSAEPPHSRCFKKDSAGAVTLQLGATQLSSAAMRTFMIDVQEPSHLMSLNKYNSFQSNDALF